jgi:hypothetical protein
MCQTLFGHFPVHVGLRKDYNSEQGTSHEKSQYQFQSYREVKALCVVDDLV